MKEIISAYEEMNAINTNLKNKKGHYKIIIIISSVPGRRCE
jgi:hypothetical protein